MKKLLLLLTFILAFALVGCSGETTVKCELGDSVIEWTYDDDGYVSLTMDGEEATTGEVGLLNDYLENNDMSVETSSDLDEEMYESYGYTCK